MKKIENINIPINCGYYSVKSDGMNYFLSKTEKIIDGSYYGGADVITLNGVNYAVGVGQEEINLDKTITQHTKILILNMISRFLTPNEETEVELTLTIPPLAFSEQKKKLPKYLKDNYDITVNNKRYVFSIVKLRFAPEGYTAYFANNINGEYNNKKVYVLDIGGKTTLVIPFKETLYSIDDNLQIDRGMHNLDTAICEQIKKLDNTSMMTADDMYYFRKMGEEKGKLGLYNTSEGNVFERFENEIIEIEHNFLKRIETESIKKGYDIKNNIVIVTGGGGKILFDEIKRTICPYATLGKNPLYDNLNGLKL